MHVETPLLSAAEACLKISREACKEVPGHSGSRSIRVASILTRADSAFLRLFEPRVSLMCLDNCWDFKMQCC